MVGEVENLLEKYKISPNIDLLKRATSIFNNDSTEINCNELVRSFELLLLINDRLIRNDNRYLKETFLTTVGAALYKRSARLSTFHERLIGQNSILEKHLDDVYLNVKRCAVMCIRNLTIKDSTNENCSLSNSLQIWCFNKLLSIVSTNSYYSDDFDCSKLLSGAWEGLHNLLELGFKPQNVIFGRLFGAVGASICFGLPGLPLVEPSTISPSTSTFQNLPNSVLTNDTQRIMKKKIKKNDKRHKKRNVSKLEPSSSNQSSESSETETHNEKKNLRAQISRNSDENPTSASASSEIKSSDVSDSSSGMDTSRAKESIKLVTIRIRLNAFHVLELCTKVCDAKTLFSYWFRFFPESNAQTFGFPSVSQTLMKEFSFKVRISALNAVRSWLDSCRSMLASAEIRTKPAPFTSFSETLANSLIEIHRTLNYVLSAEKYAAAIAQCTRCFATLVSVTPFEKLSKNLLSKILSQCKTLLVHKDISVRLGALSVYCASVKTNYSSELESLFLPPSLPWMLNVCSLFVRKESVLFDVHCVNSIPINIEALQTLTSMYSCHGKHLENSIETCVLIGFDCVNAPEIELQLHGLKLLNALFAPEDVSIDETKIQFNWIAKFLVPSSKSSTSILIESLILCSKFIEKNISIENVNAVKTLFLNYCSQNGSFVQTTALKLVPILLQRFKNDLQFTQKCFDAALTVLEFASANVAERACSSLVYMTRIVSLNPNEDTTIRREEMKIVQEAIIRALLFCQTSTVLRLKPSCMCATNVYLSNFSKHSHFVDSQFGLVIDLLIPIIVAHSNVEVVKVQQTALESAAAIFELDKNILANIKVSQLIHVVEAIIDVLKKPTVKLRNILLAAKAISLIPSKLWKNELSNIVPMSLDALIVSLERLDVDAFDKNVDNCVKENVANEIVHCFIVILSFASTKDLNNLRLHEENVQKILCYYVDLYKGMLFHQNEFSTNDNKEKWSSEYRKCLESLENFANNDDKNFLVLLSFFRD